MRNTLDCKYANLSTLFEMRAAVTFEINQILQAELREVLDPLQEDLQISRVQSVCLLIYDLSLKQQNVHEIINK